MIAAAALLQLAPAHAQSMRTYVSGSGKDGNPCTFSAPCQTLQAALRLTQAGGEIQSLNSADYGYVTITQAVTITGAHGAAGVSAANVSGITVNAGANDVVTLRGLDIDGAGSGANGILFASGATLNVDHSVIRGFATGISIGSTSPNSFSISNTQVSNNATGVSVQSPATSSGVLSNAQVVNNASGVVAAGAGSATPATLTIQGSTVANNSTVGVLSNGYSNLTVSNTTIANNGVGLEAQGTGALLQVTGSTVSGNGTGWSATNSGQVYSPGDNSIAGNTAGNTAPPATPTSTPTFVAKNIVTDFGAKCNGSTDDSPAFAAFNTWALANQGTLQVILTIPSGSNCTFLTDIGSWWAKGIKNLIVSGYGATISGSSTAGFFLGGRGQYQDNAHSARLATVSAGATSVQLLSLSQAKLFTVGNYALITGFDLQGLWNSAYGFPSNPHFFEYVMVTAIDSATGVVAFSAPLKNTYQSTWPNYNSGSAFEVDSGGPATLYALDPSWDTQVEYRGLTISQTGQTISDGRSVTYRDVTFTGDLCGIPSQNLSWTAIDVAMPNCVIEMDKLVGTVTLNGVTVNGIVFQSSSIDLLNIANSTVSFLNGTPKKTVISDSTITNFNPGAYAYGRSDEVVCTNCVLSNIGPMGVLERGPNNIGVNNAYTMSGGVITIPNTYGAVRWAVPGTNLFWAGAYSNETAFRVLAVSQDASNTYVHTSLSGGFPSVPNYSGQLAIRVHPAPKFTCINCTGSADALDLSQAPAGVPLYSYSKRTYTPGTLNGGVGPGPNANVWGALSSITYNVTRPYTGAQAALSLNALSMFNNLPTLKSDGTVYTYAPVIDLKAAGLRTVTPTGVTGAQAADANLSVPEAVWFTGTVNELLSSNVSTEPAATWPSVTIEIITDQGVVNP